MAVVNTATGSNQLTALLPVLERRRDFLGAWRQVCESELGDMLEIETKDFDGAFDRELERLEDPDVVQSPAMVDVALQATASCLARRGVPLSHLLAVSAYSAKAARRLLGERLDVRTLAALSELDAARASAYARAYKVQNQPERARCTQPLVNLRRGPANGNGSSEPRRDWGIIGSSAAIQRVRAAIAVAAQGPQNLLVTGASGSGKELVARAIHEAAGGERSKFLAVNCAALPSHLVESELFGHVRGAFTGAAGEYAGLFRAAHGGTLFLDELTEMGPEIQAKLLRVLEERSVRPVGGVAEVPVSVRVIASTNRDAAAAVASGHLRSDLYYRLQGFSIHVPPLRERREDIGSLAEHFLATFCHRRCGCIWGISQRALDVLTAADWPGNVRELRNAIEHAVTTGESGLIQVADLPPHLTRGAKAEEDRAPLVSASDLPSLAEAESQLIRATLDHFGGNKVRAAMSLGISRHKLYDRLRKLGIP